MKGVFYITTTTLALSLTSFLVHHTLAADPFFRSSETGGFCQQARNDIMGHVAQRGRQADVTVAKVNVRDGKVYSIQSRDEFSLRRRNSRLVEGTYDGRFEDHDDRRRDRTTIGISYGGMYEVLNRWDNTRHEVVLTECSVSRQPDNGNTVWILNGYKDFNGGHTRTSITLGVSLLRN